MDPLFINALLYLLLMFYYIKHKKKNTILIYLTAIYTFVAIIAFLINDTQYYTWGKYYRYGNMLRQPATLLPLLYVFVGYLIFTWPIKSWSNENIKSICPINMKMAKLFCYFSIGISLLYISLGINTALSISDYAEVYNNMKQGEGRTIVSQIGIICNGLRSASFVLAFYFFTKDIQKYKLGAVLLLTTIFARYMDATLAASRGALFFLFFELIIAFLLFKNFLSEVLKRKIILLFIVSFIFIITLVISISIARFDEQIVYSISSYFGESFINFSRIFWDFPSKPLYGQYTFQNILKIDTINTNLPLGYFKTFAGSAYVDFGKIGGLLFLIVQSLFWKTMLGKMTSNTTLQQLMIYHFVIIMILTGVFGSSYSGWSCYAMLFLSYIFFKNMQIGSDKKLFKKY